MFLEAVALCDVDMYIVKKLLATHILKIALSEVQLIYKNLNIHFF